LAYPHGVYKYEIPTSLVPPVRTEAGLPIFVGTAPVHLGSDPEALLNVNTLFSRIIAISAYSQ
jgi:hypothetical protein